MGIEEWFLIGVGVFYLVFIPYLIALANHLCRPLEEDEDV